MTFVDSFTRARESVAGHSVIAEPETHPYLQSLAQALSEIVALGEPVVGGGSGIANRLTKWTSATVIGNANVTEDGASLSPVASGGLTLGTRTLPWGEIDLINVAALVWASGGVISQYIVGDTTSLRFARGATEQLRMTATDFAPLTTGGLTLGIATLRWGKFWGQDADFSTTVLVSGDLTAGSRLVLTTATSKVVPGATSLSHRNNADSADNLLIVDAGDATFRTKITMPGPLILTTAASKIVPGATSLSLRNTADSADNMLVTDAGAVTFRSTVGGITTLTATTLAGTLSTAAQPNVTSLGTLTSLTMGGTLTMGANTLALATSTVSGAPTWSSNQAITLSTAAQPNVTSLGTLTSLTMGGTLTMGANTIALASATVSGTPTWSSNQAITLSTAAQPNITSVGTLTSLTVSGAVTKTAAGGATATQLLGGVLSANAASLVQSSGSTETDLKTYTVLANTLDATYRAIRFEAHGTFAANANLKTVRIYYGGTLQLTFSTTFNNGGWRMSGIIHYTGASAQEIWVTMEVSAFAGTMGTPAVGRDRALPAKSNTADQILKITGQGTTTGDVGAYAFDVRYDP